MATKAVHIDFDEAAAPATPAAGDVRLYAKTDGLLYSKDDAGAETLVSGGAGGGGGGTPTFVGAIVYNNTTQVLSANAKVAFNSEDLDTDGFHDTATNNSRLTIPTGLGGKYLVSGSIYRGTSDTPELHFIINNTTKVRGSYRAMAFAGGPLSVIVVLAAGDYIELQTPSSGATVGSATDPEKMNTLSISLLGT